MCCQYLAFLLTYGGCTLLFYVCLLIISTLCWWERIPLRQKLNSSILVITRTWGLLLAWRLNVIRFIFCILKLLLDFHILNVCWSFHKGNCFRRDVLLLCLKFSKRTLGSCILSSFLIFQNEDLRSSSTIGLVKVQIWKDLLKLILAQNSFIFFIFIFSCRCSISCSVSQSSFAVALKRALDLTSWLLGH